MVLNLTRTCHYIYQIFSACKCRKLILFPSIRVESVVEEYPCVDFPVQSNFGSPYSASISVFFDYDKMSQSQSDQALQSLVLP